MEIVTIDEETQLSDCSKNFTNQQSKFVDLVVIGNNPTESARLCGYAHPKQSAYYLLRLPKIAHEIRARSEVLLMTHGAVVGVGTLISIAQNEKASSAARVSAANSLLDRAGIGVKAPQKPALSDKPVADMDLSELDAFIRAGSAALERQRATKGAQDVHIIEESAQTNPPHDQ